MRKLQPLTLRPRAEIWVRCAKVFRVLELRIRQARAQSIVAIGTEFLWRRCHRATALMLGMATDAAAIRFAERRFKCRILAHALGQQLPVNIRMFMHLDVAGNAGLVLHRLKLFDMAGLTIIAQTFVRIAQWPRRPARIRMEARTPIFDAMRRGISVNRPSEKQDEDAKREHPSTHPPRRQFVLEGEKMLGIAPLGSIRKCGNTGNSDDRVAAFRSNQQAMPAKAKLCAIFCIEFRKPYAAPVMLEREPADRFNAHQPAAERDHLRVMQINREVLQMNVAGGIAPYADLSTVNCRRADNLAAIIGVRNLADDEAHAPALPVKKHADDVRSERGNQRESKRDMNIKPNLKQRLITQMFADA